MVITSDILDWRPVFEGKYVPKKDWIEVVTEKEQDETDEEKEKSIMEVVSNALRHPAVGTAFRIVRYTTLAGAVFTLIPLVGAAVAPLLGLKATGAVAAVSAAGVSSSGGMTAVAAMAAPVSKAVAASAGWDRLISKVLWIIDYVMDGVIIFSGVSWMFGNRTKAIELLFSAGVGYIIVRHHEDIKNFFALL